MWMSGLLPQRETERSGEGEREGEYLDRMPLKRTLKNCNRDAEEFIASDRVGVGKDSVFFKGLAMLQLVYGQHKLNLVFLFFSFFLWGSHKSGVDLGRL